MVPDHWDDVMYARERYVVFRYDLLRDLSDGKAGEQ